jgi:phosphoglycolate phosphatase-like HAD superfamily hydrolase
VTPILVLFDIDGTLLDTGGAGREAMRLAFAEVAGDPDACAHFSFAGMTDRAIAREGLRAAGRPTGDADLDALLEAYLRHLGPALARRPGRALPGAAQAVETTRAWPRAVVGLGTGNVRRGAFAKLEACALGGRFELGGFGCDAEDRAALLWRGVERGAARAGEVPERCAVVVVGDTPRDVAAARAIGALAVAVATGGHDAEALSACGADRVLASLEDLVRDADEVLAAARGTLARRPPTV